MPHSVKKRFLFSLVSNALRSLMSFFTGLLVAKALSPAGYGELSFLLGSFVSIRSLLDLGTSNAFYTFISQTRRPIRYYSYYGLWLSFQFLLTVAAVAVIIPDPLLAKIWLGHARSAVLLAFAASFFQQQMWLTVNQVGEAARKTIKVQYLNIALAAFYMTAVFILSALGVLSVRSVLLLIIFQYLAVLAAAALILWPFEPASEQDDEVITLGGMVSKYRIYCAPLAALSVVGFIYDFSDKWLLQRFGGADQQGFYQVAFQFSAISVLATTSILNIFWKEIAEAAKLNNEQRIFTMFRKVSRGLYMFGAVLSGFLIPWSGQIISVFLGKAYAPAGAVLGLMLVFPLHQSLGQVAGTMLLAGERTKQYMLVSAAGMLISLPVSYFLQAPSAGIMLPGLNLGAIGMAVKMVGLNIISVNVILWLIARNHGWKFDYLFQIVGLGAMFMIGYLSKLGLGCIFAGINSMDRIQLLPPFLLSGLLYLILAGAVIWLMPWLIGMDRDEIRGHISKVRTLLLKKTGIC
jgi:O-antigen/teichoic acid export membrane protein